MSAIVFIPARSKSKSIIDKNIKPFLGKPLLQYVIDAGKCSCANRVVVATENDKYADIANDLGAEVFFRSDKSARDDAITEECMLEFIEHDEISPFDTIVLLQATSPYTTWKDINNVIDMITFQRYDSVLSVYRKHAFIWSKKNNTVIHGVPINYSPAMRPRRQEWDGELFENGAIYASWVGGVRATGSRISGCIGLYEMGLGFELDTPNDWIVGEKIMEELWIRQR